MEGSLCAQAPPQCETSIHGPQPASVKALLESSGFTSIPSSYSYSGAVQKNEAISTASEPQETIPTVDLSLLTSGDPDLRSKAIQQLAKACQEWGIFMLVNHGVPERLMKAVLDGCDEFFNLPLAEKQEYAGREVWNPIRFGTGVDAKLNQVFMWRDFLKVFVHPQFHFPTKPHGFSEVLREYSKSTRELLLELLKAISESLGLEEGYIAKSMNLETGFQLFAANLYPRCPQPELAMGIPPHSDHGLLTFLIYNGVGGLQIQHQNGKWLNVNALPNSFLVNVADQLEILSNGKCKSVVHRAVVNNRAARISTAMAHGPSLDTVVSPASELVDREGRPPAFMPMNFKKYIELQQTNSIQCSPYLDQLRLDSA